MPEPEILYAVRRADGEPMSDDFTFMTVSGPDDWSSAELDADGHDTEVEYELVKMLVEVVGRRAFGSSPEPCDAYLGELTGHAVWWDLVVAHERPDTWPAHRDYVLCRFDDEDEAFRHLEAIPHDLVVYDGYRSHALRRDQLHLLRKELDGWWTACDTCGQPQFLHGTKADQ